MPTIDPNLVPTVQPGSLFSTFTATGSSLNIRWLTATDPVYFEVTNRPIADVAVRQLIMAKALDALQVRLGHQNAFPYVIQPQIDLGSSTVDVPLSIIWDLHVSLAKKWEWVRLAKIKRISGSNPGTGDEYTGDLRFIFTGQESGSSTETAIFMADYMIDSALNFQIKQVDVVTTLEESVAIGSGESETIAGHVIFRTLDVTDETVQTFLDAVAPPPVTTTDSEGNFVTPAEYEIADNIAGGSAIANDFSTVSFSHGTGMLTASAINNIPSLDSDLNTWLNTFNYPFRDDATLTSSTPAGVTIPQGLFKEFKLIAPNGDRPTDNNSGDYFPVWISRISRDDVNADQATLYFSTFNTSDSPSTTAIEFASLVLERDSSPGDIVSIDPYDDLFPLIDKDVDSTLSAQFRQGFGQGHVRLSSLWGLTDGEVSDFFDSMIPFAGDTVDFTFTMTATAVSSFGLSRVPHTIPTTGESEALSGSTSSLESPIYPSADNRYVVEADQGLGDQVDFHDPDTGLAEAIREHASIGQYGKTGALAHRIVYLEVDTSQGDLDYDRDILPRLQILFGRDPGFGDFWHNGTTLNFFNGNDWQTLG